nr:hypothetical protein [Thermoanaerobaculia bacterium]
RLGATFGGLDEERIAAIGAGLADFVRGAASDERGLIRAFNVYVTRHLAAYYNTSIYRAVRQVEARMPQSSPAAEWLFREAGHVCVFNTFGNVLLSPEWEGLIGPLSGLAEDTLSYCCAIARGLGFGRWTLAEHVPGKRLVLRTPATYESIFDLCNHGASTRGRCYILQGAAVALMVLAQKVPWTESPSLTPEFYASLFSAGPLPWKVEETRCIAKGDSYCEAVVTEV